MGDEEQEDWWLEIVKQFAKVHDDACIMISGSCAMKCGTKKICKKAKQNEKSDHEWISRTSCIFINCLEKDGEGHYTADAIDTIKKAVRVQAKPIMRRRLTERLK